MISVDNLEDNTKFAQMHEADYPILADPSKEIANKYGVLGKSGLPQRWTFYIGPDGNILHIDKAPGTANAGAAMVAKLAELNIAKRSK